MSDSENERIESPPPIDDNAELDSADDLFGDDGGDDNNQDDGHLSETLSEHSLGPEDEERYGYDDEDAAQARQVTKEELVMDVDLFRHRVPKPADGMLHSLRIPSFIRIQPEEYHADTYEPTVAELEDSLTPHPKSTARYRRDPVSGALQSNAALYHWDDGSVTLAVGEAHFEVLTKSLAPSGAAGQKVTASKPYQELQDAHYYAAAAHLSSSLLLTVAHVGEQYTVRANRTVADDALQRLTDRLHAASQTSAGAGANMIIRTMRDPELAKKEAEMAEKERERARRRRENASARLEGGYGTSRSGRTGGALSIGDLEGGGRRSGAGAGRKRGVGGVPRPKRRRPEYDSDDELPHGARRNDDYDKEDDFIAPSDDEMSEGGAEDDDDEEELDDDDDDDDDDRHTSRRTKRQRTAEAEDEEDAEADPDEDVPARTSGGGANDAARRARRHIIDDDEDEDEE